MKLPLGITLSPGRLHLLSFQPGVSPRAIDVLPLQGEKAATCSIQSFPPPTGGEREGGSTPDVSDYLQSTEVFSPTREVSILQAPSCIQMGSPLQISVDIHPSW